jgi:SAM-dependent methyltransferase
MRRPSGEPDQPGGGPFRFESVDADGYDRTHAGYAAEAVRWLAGSTGLRDRVVVDLAAGTGKLTWRLVEQVSRVLAIEPADNMLARLAWAVPDAFAVRGTAERLPLADGSVDCVTVGGSFHLFEPERAVAEIARVLRAAGILAVFWKVYDMTAAVQVRMDAIARPYLDQKGHAIHRADPEWSAALVQSDHFGPLRVRTFPNDQTIRAGDLATVLATSTDIAWLPAADQRALLEEVDRMARGLPAYVRLPCTTEVHVYFRK